MACLANERLEHVDVAVLFDSRTLKRFFQCRASGETEGKASERAGAPYDRHGAVRKRTDYFKRAFRAASIRDETARKPAQPPLHEAPALGGLVGRTNASAVVREARERSHARGRGLPVEPELFAAGPLALAIERPAFERFGDGDVACGIADKMGAPAVRIPV